MAVLSDATAYAALVAALAARGFVPTSTISSDPADRVPDITIFQEVDVGRIGVLVSKTDFETRAIARAVPVGRLRVATIEDLVAYKLIAGRTRDFGDIEDIVRTQTHAGREIDWDAIAVAIEPWEIADRLVRARNRTR